MKLEELDSNIPATAKKDLEDYSFLMDKCPNKSRFQNIILTNPKAKESADFLLYEFDDWYENSLTPSVALLNYIKDNYPKDKFKKIACLGDGKHCHLGRKLAKLGYQVVVIDPESQKKFAFPSTKTNPGYLRISNSEFHEHSATIIDWADILVGSKIPFLSETLVNCGKPVAFTISSNPEYTKTKYDGKPIKSAEELHYKIIDNPHIKCVKVSNSVGDTSVVYTHNGNPNHPNYDLSR